MNLQVKFPCPVLSNIDETAAFKPKWGAAVAKHGEDFCLAIESIGSSFKANPNDPIRYFEVLFLGVPVSFQCSLIEKTDALLRVGKKSRLEVLSSIRKEMCDAYPLASDRRMVFYSSVQCRMNSVKNFKSVASPALNDILFHIMIDVLRADGFDFCMD